jgi:hypothetical protein
MEIQPNQPDAAIDKTFAAIKNAVPPEGMEARITQRLQQQATAPSGKLFWRDLFTGSALAGAWWRGAVSGAVAAMLIAGAAIFAGHAMRREPAARDQIATHPPAAAPTLTSAESVPAAEDRRKPCASSGAMRVASIVPARQSEVAATGTMAPSHPAPVLPLTTQERQLVRLARTADPKQLDTLNPDTQAKLQAQDAAEFEKFFTPPHAPPLTENNE